MYKAFRTWWIRSQRHGEKAIELDRLGLEYHIDLGQQLAYVGNGMCSGVRRVYREVFGLDGNDYALEQECDWLKHLAEVNRTDVLTERMAGLKRAIERYTAFPSDMCGAPDSWVIADDRYDGDYIKERERAERQHQRDLRLLELKRIEREINPPMVIHPLSQACPVQPLVASTHVEPLETPDTSWLYRLCDRLFKRWLR